jgi:two-component system chemotaxis response regulator CheY
MQKKILIIDDSEFMRKNIKDILQKNGYEVIGEASSGYKGFDLYTKFKPDLVTMDMVMFGIHGLETTKKIISHDKNANIIIVSAMGQQNLIVESIKAGAKGFVIKPFAPEELVNEVKRILGE